MKLYTKGLSIMIGQATPEMHRRFHIKKSINKPH